MMDRHHVGQCVLATAIVGMLLVAAACTGGPDPGDPGQGGSSSGASGDPSSSSSSSGSNSSNSSTSSGATTSSTSTSSTSSSGSSSGGTVETPPPTLLKLDASKFMKGTFYITGTITLPTAVAGGVQLNIVGEGLTGNYVGPAGTTGASTTATYAITGLPAGNYKVQARVDTNGNQTLGDPGDFDGWARGTVDAPTTDQADADLVPVNASVSGVDFGLATVP